TTRGMRAEWGASVEQITIDELALAREAGENLAVAMQSEAAAYVMYTSGSTGKPKGVEVPHRAIGRLVLNNGYAKFGPGDRVALAANPAFYASTMEVWGPLLNGGMAVVIEQATVLAPERFRRSVHRLGIDVLFLTTALVNQYAEVSDGTWSQLRYLITGGE